MTNRVKRYLLKIRHRHEQRERDKELEGLKYCLEVRSGMYYDSPDYIMVVSIGICIFSLVMLLYFAL